MSGLFAHWPNRITALRFAGSLVVFLVLSHLVHEPPAPLSLEIQLAFWLFVVTATTDVLDGWLARRYHHESAFGRIADPFVDKVLVLGAMVYLAVLEWSRPWFPAWIVVVVLAREFLVTGIRGYVESLGQKFGADAFGKAKMLFQCTAVGVVLGLFAFDWSEAAFRFYSIVGHVLVWGTLITSVGSGLTYVQKTWRLLSELARQRPDSP